MINRPRHRSYLVTVGAVVATLCLLGLAVNIVVDPLMFAGGNRLFDRNYVFNERLSKLAYYRGQEGELDCIIVGSSRMTYLDGRGLSNAGCANYAFSGARPLEILSYLRYLRAMGARPTLVVVGIDALDVNDPGEGVPGFVTRGEPLGGMLRYYFSLDTLRYSWQTLTRTQRSPAYYDHGLRKYVGEPTRDRDRAYAGDQFYIGGYLDGPSNTAEVYAQMAAVFPGAEWVGVVPPISQWARGRLADRRLLADYVTALRQVAAPFDRVYDFSWLPDECMDFTGSPDGVHYAASVWDHYLPRIADTGDADLIKGPGGMRPAAALQAEYARRVRQLPSRACAAAGGTVAVAR